jgi:hypothetical protein
MPNTAYHIYVIPQKNVSPFVIVIVEMDEPLMTELPGPLYIEQNE